MTQTITNTPHILTKFLSNYIIYVIAYYITYPNHILHFIRQIQLLIIILSVCQILLVTYYTQLFHIILHSTCQYNFLSHTLSSPNTNFNRILQSMCQMKLWIIYYTLHTKYKFLWKIAQIIEHTIFYQKHLSSLFTVAERIRAYTVRHSRSWGQWFESYLRWV